MTSDEFASEALQSGEAPGNFSEMLSLQKKYQGIALSILSAFHKVCVRNGIEYMLTFGSLLGAVRDGGMIPWDYDVDVFVHARDREALLLALEECLPPPFYYDSLENNPRRQGVLTRIGMRPYSTLHLHVDVFYLAGVPEDEGKVKGFCRRLRRSSQIIAAKNTPLFEIKPWRSPRGWLEVAVGKVLFLFRSKKKAFERYLMLSSEIDSRAARRVINANSYGGSYFLSGDLWRESDERRMDGGVLMVPSRSAEALEELFGDWQALPPLKNRIAETAEHYREFLEMEKIPVEDAGEDMCGD